MTARALIVRGVPSRAYYTRGARALADAMSAAHAFLQSVGTLRAGTVGENANLTATLSRAALRYFEVPPLGASVSLVESIGEVFAGQVATVDVSAGSISIGVNAFGGDPLPLRTTAALGGFRDAAVIPHRYGPTGGTALQFNAGRTIFIWADHACLAVDEVTIGGADPGGWVWRNDVDASGHPVCLVEFSSPVDEGASVLVRGRGKMDAVTGALLTNPADVLFDVLVAIGGANLPAARFDAFRVEAANAGLTVGGSLTAADTGQTVARALCASLGARYSPDAVSVAFLDPGGAPRPAQAVLGRSPQTVTRSASAADLANSLTLQYGHEDGQPREVLTVECPDLVARNGRKTASPIDAPWIGDSRTALDVATRLLAQAARPAWLVTVGDIAKRALRVGDTIGLAVSTGLPAGPYRVLTRETNTDTDSTSITLSVPVGDVPAIALTSQASQYDPNQYSGVTVDTQGSDKVFHLYDVDTTVTPPVIRGDLANAAVKIDTDLSITRYTDATGRVSFPASLATPGPHTIYITAADGRQWLSQVII
jgi:hypothetical protein